MKTLLTILSISITLFSFCQPTLTPKQESVILNNCNVFIKQRTNGLMHNNYNPSALQAVTTDSLFMLLEMDQEFVKLLEYDLSKRTDSITGIIINDTILGCKVVRENGEYILDVIEENGVWKIQGYNGNKIEKQHYLDMKHHLDSARIVGAEHQKIKSVVHAFVYGLNELKIDGKSDTLKKATTPLAYQYFVLKQELDELSEYPNKNNLVIKEIQYVRMDTVNKANCRIYIVNEGGVRINLFKENERWIVTGLSQNQLDTTDIVEVQNNINTYQKKSEIIASSALFNTALTNYLVGNSNHQLDKYTTRNFYEYLNLFKMKCGDYDPNLLNIKGLYISENRGKFSFSGDTATYISYSLEAQFIKLKKTWQVASICNVPKEELNAWQLQKDFRKIINYFQIQYPVYINEEEMEEAIFEIPKIEDDYIPKIDTVVRMPLEKLSAYAQFSGGQDKFVEFMGDNDNEENYFVSFIVERNGDITNVKFITPNIPANILKQLNSKIKQMPNWEPAVNYRSIVRSQVIIPISI